MEQGLPSKCMLTYISTPSGWSANHKYSRDNPNEHKSSPNRCMALQHYATGLRCCPQYAIYAAAIDRSTTSRPHTPHLPGRTGQQPARRPAGDMAQLSAEKSSWAPFRWTLPPTRRGCPPPPHHPTPPPTRLVPEASCPERLCERKTRNFRETLRAANLGKSGVKVNVLLLSSH